MTTRKGAVSQREALEIEVLFVLAKGRRRKQPPLTGEKLSGHICPIPGDKLSYQKEGGREFSWSVWFESAYVYLMFANQFPERTAVLTRRLRRFADIALMGKQQLLNVVSLELLNGLRLGLLK